MTNTEILEKFNSEEVTQIVGTMYGGKYPRDTLTTIAKRSLTINDPGDAFLYIWGYPGPDYNKYKFEDYGVTWAFTEDEFRQSEV